MPDTAAFLVYGYIIIFGILAVYLLSLAIKAKRVLRGLKEISGSKVFEDEQ